MKLEKNLLQTFKKMAQKHPYMINDMAVTLFTMDYIHSAIDLLTDHLDHPSRQWMYIDFLLESKQYIKCLNYIDYFFQNNQPDFDMTFELFYYKAYSYYGLKEYEKAKKLIKHLIKIKPDHQAVLTLFFKCKDKKASN